MRTICQPGKERLRIRFDKRTELEVNSIIFAINPNCSLFETALDP